MLTISGCVALSSFRLVKLLTQLQEIDPDIAQIEARYIHFISLSDVLSLEQKDYLQVLLDYGKPATINAGIAPTFLVIPRKGTISPWSSKATEIAKSCGLFAINRIERGVQFYFQTHAKPNVCIDQAITNLLHDRMTEQILAADTAIDLFVQAQPRPLQTLAIIKQKRAILEATNIELGLALSDSEIDYLIESFQDLGRDPTDVELMMFAQANSEHCRHKIFNARWIIDGVKQKQTLFDMIRNTVQQSPEGIITAYSDNASIVEGHKTKVLIRNAETGIYSYSKEAVHLLMKVETHNHPTAIAPYFGAATGSGGEIRDEAATGKGSQTKAGLVGFSVTHLRIPKLPQPWERADWGKPQQIASALTIMLEGPVGSAAFNNEFGRPTLAGYLRNFEISTPSIEGNKIFAYHKPIMLAGGMGSIRPMLVEKAIIPAGALILVLGGPAMLIGLGGGAASSQVSGVGFAELDFASVQRENPEMQRRCQEVINHCNAFGNNSPIISIHDVGAGGLSNAVPEIIRDCRRGGSFELRKILNADASMSPMQIWCNEAQERYIIAIKPKSKALFISLCERERCLYAIIGEATKDEQLKLSDSLLATTPISLPMALLFGEVPKMHRQIMRQNTPKFELNLQGVTLAESIRLVLAFPAVADKSFLIHIGDRSVTGLVARDQLVGPWQTPVSDVAVTASGYYAKTGEAMAIGERAPIAVIDAPAAARLAVGESLTNLAAARIESLSQVKLSANWMAATGSSGEEAALFDAVKAVGMELCPQLGIAIPVGKDSLTMQTVWQQDGRKQTSCSPVSLIITAFAPVVDINKTLVPQLQKTASQLLLIDLGQGRNRLGGSVLAQTCNQIGAQCPNLDDTSLFKIFFNAVQKLNKQGHILAYHDRSDGGLLASVCEMMFAGRVGVTLHLEGWASDTLPALFNEELGAVMQIDDEHCSSVLAQLSKMGLGECVHIIGQINASQMLKIYHEESLLYVAKRSELQRIWAETSYQMQALRDNPDCALQQYDRILDDHDPGLTAKLTFNLDTDIAPPYTNKLRPHIAILREQGVNGHMEMAAAFDRAGFAAVDVHMSDIIAGRISLDYFQGLVACGGFSFGDALGAGGGWAKSILFNLRAHDQFEAFFNRDDSFGLGVCNGCQMFSHLKQLIPGAQHWPQFVQNISGQFEARVALVAVQASPSILLSGMEGSRIPVSIAHGEGRAEFSVCPEEVMKTGSVALCYVDNAGDMTLDFPANPNGSPLGITGMTTIDGRFTIMMPHPERCFRTVQNSWHPQNWGEYGPWMRIFRNARTWVG